MSESPGLSLRCGVVCAAPRGGGPSSERPPTEGYVIAGDGRVAWLEIDGERHAATDGAGWVVSVIGGEAMDDVGAFTAMNAVARVLAKLHQPSVPKDPPAILRTWLADAHLRMVSRLRERGRTGLAASLALAWVVNDSLCWAELGTARAWLRTSRQLRRLGAPIPFAESQRVLRGSVALGDDAAIHLRPGVNCGSVVLRAGDRVILGTGGLWTAVDEGALASLAGQIADPQEAAVAIHERAVRTGQGTSVTVVVADVVPASEQDAQPRPTLRSSTGMIPVEEAARDPLRRPARPRRPGKG